MFKQITAIFFLLAFLAQTFHKVYIVVDFYGNRDVIAKTLCENKYRPKMHCNGQCQLAKKLQQEEKKDQSNPERKLENKNEVFSSRAFYPTLTSNTSTLVATPFHLTNTGAPLDIASDFFHPPGA